MRNLFHLKIKNPHLFCAICEGVCTCKENYVGETKRNVKIRWEGYLNINKISEPSRHLKNNPTHALTWKALMTAPVNDRGKKNLKALFIAHKRPSLY